MSKPGSKYDSYWTTFFDGHGRSLLSKLRPGSHVEFDVSPLLGKGQRSARNWEARVEYPWVRHHPWVHVASFQRHFDKMYSESTKGGPEFEVQFVVSRLEAGEPKVLTLTIWRKAADIAPEPKREK